MTSEKVLALLGLAGAVVTVLGGGGVLGWWWRKQPDRQHERERSKAADDAILGRPKVDDRSGEPLDVGQPGLVHVTRENSARLAKVEEAVVEFRHMSGLFTEVLGRLDGIDRRVQILEDVRVEKVVGQFESGQMWRAVADNAVNDADESTEN